jgi:hypothetical protein
MVLVSLLRQIADDISQRGVTILVRLARSQQIQVGTVQQQYVKFMRHLAAISCNH